jgi:hypothetical protein
MCSVIFGLCISYRLIAKGDDRSYFSGLVKWKFLIPFSFLCTAYGFGALVESILYFAHPCHESHIDNNVSVRPATKHARSGSGARYGAKARLNINDVAARLKRLLKSKFADKKRPLGLKPAHIRNDLRGPEGPLFHGGADIHEFFRSPLKSCPSQTRVPPQNPCPSLAPLSPGC